jgi:hypothetical protein
MKRKRPKKTNREWFEEHREQFERTDRLLRERIEYHRRKSEEERAARERG